MQLAAVAVRLLYAAEAGSDHQLAWAELLGWTATSEDQVELIAALLGAWLLKERFTPRRVVGTLTIVAGVMALRVA